MTLDPTAYGLRLMQRQSDITLEQLAKQTCEYTEPQ